MENASSLQLVLVGISFSFLVGNFMSMVVFLPKLVTRSMGRSISGFGRCAYLALLGVGLVLSAAGLYVLKIQTAELSQLDGRRSFWLLPGLGSFLILIVNLRLLELFKLIQPRNAHKSRKSVKE